MVQNENKHVLCLGSCYGNKVKEMLRFPGPGGVTCTFISRVYLHKELFAYGALLEVTTKPGSLLQLVLVGLSHS